MDKSNTSLANKKQMCCHHHQPSSHTTSGLCKGPIKTTTSSTIAETEASSLPWSPCELMNFLRDLSTLSEMGLIFLFREDTARSTRLLRMALRVSSSFPDQDSALTTAIIYRVILSVHRIDQSLRSQSASDLDKRRRLYEVVVDLTEWSIKHEEPVSKELWQYNLVALKTLADMYQTQKEPQRARLMLEKAVQYELKVTTNQDTDRVLSVTATFNALARLCVDLQDADGALHHYRQALQFQQGSLEMDHPIIIATLQSMANLYQRCHRYHDTLSLFHHILILQDTRGFSLLETASTLSSMGSMYYLLKDYTNALHNYHEALTMLLRHHGGDFGAGYDPQIAVNHFDIAMTLNSIGMIHSKVGNHEEARRTFQKCLSMHMALANKAAKFNEEDASTRRNNDHAMSTVLYNLAIVYMQKGEDDVALELFNKSIKMKKRATMIVGDGSGSSTSSCRHGEMASNLQKIGKVHIERGEDRVAILYLEEALAMFSTSGADNGGGNQGVSGGFHQLMITLANLHFKVGQVDQMMSYLTEASRRTGSTIDEIYQAFYHIGLSMNGARAYSLGRILPPGAAAA